ncbi:ester cyclase [Pseudonocardia sp. CA-107938]|uniref:ester cyclase n=1 Tax=Pseudonocardia sp. CA-107938 TaxID=3240021 RepID=UPI003D934E5B
MTDVPDGPQVFGATDDERRIVETLYRAVGGEPDLLDDILAPDWEDIPSIPGQPPGPEGLKPHIKEFHACFANARVVLHDVVAASGRVAVRGALTGTHRGEFLGVPRPADRVRSRSTSSTRSRTAAWSAAGTSRIFMGGLGR